MRTILLASTIAVIVSGGTPSRGQQSEAPKAKAEATPMIRLLDPPDIPAGDVHRPVVEKVRALMNESCTSCHSAGVALDKDKPWGLSVVVADSTLRQQLKLGERGLVVTAVAPKSQADRDGLKEKDILLASDDKPLATVDDLKALAVEGDRSLQVKPGEPVHAARTFALKLLRDGEPVEVKLHPGAHVARPTSGTVGNLPQSTGLIYLVQSLQDPGYWIGVSATPASDILRRHLKLPEKAGLVVDQVHKGSPAEEAGLKPNDVFLTIGHRPVMSVDELVKAVQSAAEAKVSLSIKLLRDGEPKVFEVRPAMRVATNWAAPLGENHLFLGQMNGVANMEVLRMVQPGSWVADVVPYLDLDQPLDWNAYLLPNAAGIPTRNLPVTAGAPQHGNLILPNATTYPNVNYLTSASPPASTAALEAQLKTLEGQIATLTATIRELKEAIREKK